MNSDHADALTAVVVDPDAASRRLISTSLAAFSSRLLHEPPRPLRALTASCGQDGLALVEEQFPSLILTELDLPDMSGFALIRLVRQMSDVPIMVVCERTLPRDSVLALDAGADDVVVKPVDPEELAARVRAVFRRGVSRLMPTPRPAECSSTDDPGEQLTFGDVVFSPSRGTLFRAGRSVHLTPTELALLTAFTRAPDVTLTHEQLFRSVWGEAAGSAEQYLRVYVRNLRAKVETDVTSPRFLQTVPRVGYRFVPSGIRMRV